MTANHLADLRTIIERLDSCGRLTRVTTEVDPKFDLAGIAAPLRIETTRGTVRKGKRFTTCPCSPACTGQENYWHKLMAQEEATLPSFVSGCIQNWQKKTCSPSHGRPWADSGRGSPPTGSIDSTYTNSRNKRWRTIFLMRRLSSLGIQKTGVRNASIQRFMVVDKDTLHINIDAGRHLGLYLEKSKAEE
ncbi:MAG: hypothetical protein CM1200mP18_15670 [Gammaproteobacteria bacterium]|nr:MAG: hypothetical protein CM1200mP18_15670 [Gammaproteobacteria bacterium]